MNSNTVTTKTKTKTVRRRSERATGRPDYTLSTLAEIALTNEEELIADNNAPNASTLGGVTAQTHIAVIDLTGATANVDGAHLEGKGTTTQAASDPIPSSLRITLQMRPRKLAAQLGLPPPASGPVDHLVLRLKPLVDKLNADDAHEARRLLDHIKENLAKGRETKELIVLLLRLFKPLKERTAEEYDRRSDDLAQAAQEKQRAPEEYDRRSNDLAQAAREKQMFNEVLAEADGIDIDG